MSDTYVPSGEFGSFDDYAAEQEYAQYHELANRVQYLTGTAPYLADDPEVLATMAQLPVPTDQLGYLAGSVSAQMRLGGTLEDLQRMEPGRARSVYAQLTKTQQEALAQMGYQPPQGSGGSSNPLLNAVGQVGGTVLGGVNTVLTKTPVVSDVFDIMNKLDNGVKTLYRAIRTDDAAGWATAAAIAGGLAAAPFTGGLSLFATAGIVSGAALGAGTTVAFLTNPSDYIDSLSDNWNGEAVFSSEAQDKARLLLRDSGLDVMARDIGWEMDAYETVELFASAPDATSDQAFMASIDRVLDRIAQPGDPRREELAGKLIELMQVPEFRESVEILQHSKVSFGRDIARLMGADPGSGTHSFLSGSMDMLFTIVTDPTLAFGAAFKWNRARRLGVPLNAGDETFDTINAIARRADEVPTIGRAYDEIAHAVDTDQPHLLWRRVPQAKGLYDDLWNYKQLRIDQGNTEPFTRDDIFDWLHEGHNFERMLAGHGVKQGFGRLMLPTYGWRVPIVGAVVAPVGRTLEAAKATIDFADDAANRAHLRKVAKQLGRVQPDGVIANVDAASKSRVTGALRYSASPDDEWRNIQRFINIVDHIPIANQVMRATGAMLASFTEMMPATRSISMVGPQAAEDIQRFVGLGRAIGMTSIERKGWYDTIMQQENIEHRINAAMSYLDTMLSAGGVRDTERGAELADKFLNKVRHRYALGEADQYLLGQRTVSRGLHPYQHTFDLPIPDLKELRQAAEKGMLLKYVHKATDSDIVDLVVNKMWKPAVLLRIGFITRAGGEELLAHLARAGPSSMLAEFGARSIAEGRIASQVLASGTELSAAQRELIERMRYVAHVRPLERMFSAFEWTAPFNDLLRRWSDFVRVSLERGLVPGLADRIPQSRRIALMGKDGGFRRSLLNGIDPKMIEYAESFGRVHAATIMREISSQNASVAAELSQGDFSLRFRDDSDELQELGFMVDRGNFRVYTAEGDAGDDIFDRMAHSGVGAILNDPVTGPIYTDVTTRWAPNSIGDDDAVNALAAYRDVQDWRVRAVLDELLTHNDGRTVNWESLLESISAKNADLGDLLRAKHRTVGETPDQARAVLNTMRTWVYQRYPSRGRNAARGLSQYGEVMMEQINTSERLLDALDSVGNAERSWFGSFLDHWGKTDETPALIRGYDNYRAELAARLADRHFDVEVQPLVQDLSYVNRTPDGTFVAHPPREGRTRLWVSQVTAETYGRIISELRIGGGEQFMERILSLWADAQPHLSGLHIDQAENALRRFLNGLALEHPNRLQQYARDIAAGGRHGDLIPLAHMGFDDPDVALRFSQFLNGVMSRNGTELSMAGRMRDNAGYVAIIDLDDKLRNYTPTSIDGAKRPIAHPAYQDRIGIIEPERELVHQVPTDDGGMELVTDTLPAVTGVVGRTRTSERVLHSWALDREYLGHRVISMADQQLVTLPDGSRHFGADPRTAIDSGVDKAVTDWLNHIGTNTTQTRIVKGVAYRNVDGTDPVEIGTKLNVREVLYDAKGNRIDYDDPDVYTLLDPTHGIEVHENWTMLGPLLRDAGDHFRGTARLVPDRRIFRDRRGRRSTWQRPADAAAVAINPPKIREFRGHWSHMKQLPNAPKIAVGPALRPIDAPTKWDRVLEFGFEQVISPAIDAIIRRPLAFHMYAEAMRENERALRWGLSKHLFGDEAAGELGELHARFGSVLESPATQIDLDAQAAEVLNVTRVLMPDVYEDLIGLESLEIINGFYGKYADDIILKGDLNQQARAASDTLDRVTSQHVQQVWAEAGPGTLIHDTIEDAFRRTRGPKPKRLYQRGDGSWTATKPRNLDDVVYVEVPPDRVSSALAKLNGPRPSADAPSLTEVKNRTKAIRDLLTRRAEDAVDQMSHGSRPFIDSDNYANQTHRRGRQRRHEYAREGYIADAQTGLAPDVFVRQMESLTGRSFGSIEEGLDAYFDAVENVRQMRLRSNDLAIGEAANELGIDPDVVEAALGMQTATEWRAFLGDTPARKVGTAKPAADAPPIVPSGKSREEIIADMEAWVTTGVKPAGWDKVSDGIVEQFKIGWDHATRHIDKFEELNGISLGEWREALEAVDRVQAMPRWTLPIRNDERPIEGVLAAYQEHLAEHLDLSWDEVQRHLDVLPPALREPLDEQSWAVLSAAHANKQRLNGTIEALAADRAIRNSMPYLDSHEIRSQAGEYVRGFFPFMYAEENFIKRWGRTLKVAPDALRKGQLIYQGLRSGGVIRTDSQGRDWFVYPGAGLVAETINRSTQAFGFGEVMPSGVVFATETKNMLPGFDVERTGMPSANPLVAMPIAGLASMFHELRPIQEALVGQVGVTQGGVQQFIPAAARRFWDVAGDENSNVKYASAMMSAIAILEHNGHGLPEGATVNQMDEYIRRVRNHTRGILAAQAFVGFLAPGSPSIQFTGESSISMENLTGLDSEIPADLFRDEYIELVQELGIEEGTIAYFELNPDHTIEDLMPFTVGQSRSTSGAPLPATAEAVRFADENEAWIGQYPMAAAWLLPQPPPGEEEFDEYAYVQQAISGMRQRRTPTEFMEALKYREGAHDYFQAREKHEQLMRESEGNAARRRQLEDVWATYKARHLALHPIFGEQLEGGESRQRRARVLDELRVAIADPGTPNVAHLAGVRDLVQTFDTYMSIKAQMSESRSELDRAKVARFKMTFEDLVTNYLIDHPELEPLWMSVLRPEASL